MESIEQQSLLFLVLQCFSYGMMEILNDKLSFFFFFENYHTVLPPTPSPWPQLFQ